MLVSLLFNLTRAEFLCLMFTVILIILAEMFNTDAKTITAWVSRARKKLKKEPELLALLSNN